MQKEEGEGGGRKAQKPLPFPLPPYPLSTPAMQATQSKWRWLYVYRANESSLCFPKTLKKQNLKFWTSLAVSVSDKFQLKTKTNHVIHWSQFIEK